MKRFSHADFVHSPEAFLAALRDAIFIYPTDTIYGIGCDATKERLVKRLRRIKGRATKPLSVIAPSKEWIRTHCIVEERTEHWLTRLPGPYTLILPLRTTIPAVVNNGAPTLGVRLLDHWFQEVVARLQCPIITTSANRAGEQPLTRLEKLDLAVDVVIDDGVLAGRPSTIVDVTKRHVEVVPR